MKVRESNSHRDSARGKESPRQDSEPEKEGETRFIFAVVIAVRAAVPHVDVESELPSEFEHDIRHKEVERHVQKDWHRELDPPPADEANADINERKNGLGKKTMELASEDVLWRTTNVGIDTRRRTAYIIATAAQTI